MSEKESERIKRTDYVESELENDNILHKAGKYTQVHERDEPKSNKRARKKEKGSEKCFNKQLNQMNTKKMKGNK